MTTGSTHSGIGYFAIDVAGYLIRAAGRDRVVRADDGLHRSQHGFRR